MTKSGILTPDGDQIQMSEAGAWSEVDIHMTFLSSHVPWEKGMAKYCGYCGDTRRTRRLCPKQFLRGSLQERWSLAGHGGR